ncbi:hypothetical protein H7E67_03845 [Clostridium gasigenes]|uniref:hypothetical protein n=1 Tax=Clostridium gasigenes TaxID=94869 RepID=UPI001627F01B|nr:hypothetical protein [Clostridium gasigenes]MBB6622555.1 hypothetical protein [Clostridium gasigenes]
MRIDEILKETQPNSHKELSRIRVQAKKKVLTESDIKELMYHSSYKRGARGAIKQVR